MRGHYYFLFTVEETELGLTVCAFIHVDKLVFTNTVKKKNYQ